MFGGEIYELIQAGSSYDKICEALKVKYGRVRGFSAANIRLFCSQHAMNARRNVADNDSLQQEI